MIRAALPEGMIKRLKDAYAQSELTYVDLAKK